MVTLHVLQVLKLARHLGHLCKPERVFVLSAQHGAGARQLREWLVAQAHPEEWEFPRGMPTDLSWPQLVAELVREKLYWAHNHEVPYKLRPVCSSVREMRDGRVAAAVVRSRTLHACNATLVLYACSPLRTGTFTAEMCLAGLPRVVQRSVCDAE